MPRDLRTSSHALALVGALLFASCTARPGDSLQAAPASGDEEAQALRSRPGPRMADGLLPGTRRWRAPGTHVQISATACAGANLKYFGGPLLQRPIVVPVFWNSLVNAQVQANMSQFYGDVLQSSYWQWLEEYDSVGLSGTTTNQAILPGTSTAGVLITPVVCPATTTGACTVRDAQVQTELVRQIGLGTLPAPVTDCTGNTKTIYMVHFPGNITVRDPSGIRSCATGGFCAYHNTGTYAATSGSIPLVYGILMDNYTSGCATGCGANTSQLANTTEVASHELAEAATDADIGLDTQSVYAYPAGWGDNTCGEIADICDDGVSKGDTITVSGRTWTVQQLWSNAQHKCTSTGPAKTCPAGDNCGTVSDSCDGTISCGSCTLPQTCGGGGTANVCGTGCVPLTVCPSGRVCGSYPDGCGGTINCGTCTGGDQCNTPTCDAASNTCSLVKVPDGSACNDGNACTQTDTCQNGVCTGSNPVSCVAQDACHAASCNVSTGACVQTPLTGNACDDGRSCTGPDVCQAGTCVPQSNSCGCSQASDCLAPGPCQASVSCNFATGTCVYVSKADSTPCDDGNACTQTDLCQAGACVGTNPVSCTAQDGCHTAGTCDPATGVCSNPKAADGTPCDDGRSCTSGDACQAGVCTPTAVTCACTLDSDCPAPNPCQASVHCDAPSGACVYANKADGTGCDDQSLCTAGETCTAGVCGNPTSTVTCGALDACHVAGTCDPSTGICSNPKAADGTACDDGRACTTGDSCQAGLCVPSANTCACSTDADCPALDQCHLPGACNRATGVCSAPAKPAGTACDDQDLCTTGETCQAGACGSPTSTVTCAASDVCHAAGSCDPATGQCSNPVVSGTVPCGDAGYCDLTGACTELDGGAPTSSSTGGTSGAATTGATSGGTSAGTTAGPATSGSTGTSSGATTSGPGTTGGASTGASTSGSTSGGPGSTAASTSAGSTSGSSSGASGTTGAAASSAGASATSGTSGAGSASGSTSSTGTSSTASTGSHGSISASGSSGGAVKHAGEGGASTKPGCGCSSGASLDGLLGLALAASLLRRRRPDAR